MKSYKNINKDCPICDKKEGACMGSSEWGHDILACSNECGLIIRDTIEKNQADPEYYKIFVKMRHLKIKLHELKYKNIKMG